MQEEASYIRTSCGEEVVVPVDLSAGMNEGYAEDRPSVVIRTSFMSKWMRAARFGPGPRGTPTYGKCLMNGEKPDDEKRRTERGPG